MSKVNGFITLHRKIMDWEWFSDANTLVIFIHLLLNANYVDGRFKGMEVKRGQLVTSLKHLSTKSGLSIQQTRTALEHLQSTGEITNLSYPQYRVITIVKYDDYQTSTNLPTSDQQTINKPSNKPSTNLPTNEQQQYNNNNNNNKGTNKQGNNKEREGSAKRFTPPTLDEVADYVKEIGADIDPQYFIDYYGTRGWKLKGGQSVKDWKACVRTWVSKEKKDRVPPQQQKKVLPFQDFQQRDYSGVDAEIMAGIEKELKAFLQTGKVDM